MLSTKALKIMHFFFLQGDSGGPMVVHDADDTPWVQVGVVSWGIGKAFLVMLIIKMARDLAVS